MERNSGVKAIFGLGNPGLKYKFTKHNIGFLVCQEFARRHNIKIKKRLYHALVGGGVIGQNVEVTVILPQTYVNKSGDCVAAFIGSDTKMNLNEILVVCDDINLPLGVIRIRKKGSAGGHNGLLSIIKALDTQNFARLRVGVGCNRSVQDKKDYVLTPFEKSQLKNILNSINVAATACEVWARSGIEAAMNRFNAKAKD